MSIHIMDLANQIDQSRKVKKLTAENSRLRQSIMDVRKLHAFSFQCAGDLMEEVLSITDLSKLETTNGEKE